MNTLQNRFYKIFNNNIVMREWSITMSFSIEHQTTQISNIFIDEYMPKANHSLNPNMVVISSYCNVLPK